MFAKAPAPVTSNPKPVLIKRFGHLVPLYPGEAEHLENDVHALAKADKHEAKQWKKIELACNSPTALKKAAYLYLTSLRCRQAAMLEVNKRLPIARRLSLHQIIEKSNAFDVLTKLDEAVQVSLVPKSSGTGYRPICNFGPVARGAQRMVLKLVRATTTPAPFQFTRLGVRKAIEEALRLITEEGLHHVAELDIKDHYPSFNAAKLVDTLPLPKAVVMQIVMAASAKYEGPHKALSLLFLNHVFHQTPPGIPQGSAASSAIAEWSVSKLKMVKIKGIAIVNFADNFFLFAKSEAALTFALKALRSAIAGLPGGSFKTEVKQEATAASRFRMLGCWIKFTPAGLDVWPTETNLEALRCQFALDLQTAEALLSSAAKEPSGSWRLEGVQAYLRLRSRIASWAAAYAFCADAEVVRDDLMWALDYLAHRFGITDAEAKAAKDPSVEVGYTPYGLSAGE
ncbi:reverse transcriptase domain-containing protein [Albidovulum sp.]|uniref:reverse transcriptase domain-containing protein n=1 Tax=Albidovulum sp. TaxID=1872424 RepID=UPI0025C3DDAF|nr:reverse transcriptase domain-containing protein [Defluviimonas sp.]